ncbi:hypothetical protein AALP_AA4G028100 [Arabis alpina]|uniref:60S ribosomal protein L18a-like protein n=1 Tax=Arabis alpina TaxID=50452 RepID=A0A087H0R7_ARAAL|nr:hypothetical protein AALP_AA4G028100 [Arabis alpina]
MSNKKDKNKVASSPSSYGTFQGGPTYPPPPHPTSNHLVAGFPHPTSPRGATNYDLSVHQYIQEHQNVPGYPVAEEGPVREEPLPCFGIGIGWFLFIIGFPFGSIPWYIALYLIVCAKINPREKPGYIACSLAAVLATMVIVYGAIKGRGAWS